jgi:DNA-binding PadR family transcriptional regulator
MKSRSADDFLPLTPAVFHILLSLSDTDRHGYAIMQDVDTTTKGQIRMGPGTLYGTIKRMIEDKLIEESSGDPAEDQRRRYYHITTLGRAVANAESTRLYSIVQVAKQRGLQTR